MSLASGFRTLGKKINKSFGRNRKETQEGVISDLQEKITIDTEHEKLLEITQKWEQNWIAEAGEMIKRQKENEDYWRGKQFHPSLNLNEDRPLMDNLLFEALETFLPIATAQNPEPVVQSDETTDGEMIKDIFKDLLVFHADRLRIRLRLKKVARFWALYLLGVVKVGWSAQQNDLAVVPLRPQKLILEPDAIINDDMEYTGTYIGEYREDSAGDLMKKFKKKKSFISQLVEKQKGTMTRYVEWWTDEVVFWTMGDEVLDIKDNPYFATEETEQTRTDNQGQEATLKIPPLNHFATPKKPYVFLSIYGLNKRPYDETSLFEQNLALQDMANKRLRQIDKNVDYMNGGWGVSGELSGLTKQEAAQAIDATRKGGGIYVPKGNINEAVTKFSGNPLPGDVYQSLLDYRNEIRNIFGIRGSTPEGIAGEKTVRGKIITKGQDQGRIGGGISEYLEQFADNVYNWFVQIMYVYYTRKDVSRILGRDKAKLYDQLLILSHNRTLTVSVKEGSLIPKDDLTKRNEAIDLWGAGALDPITLFKRLDFADPEEAAKKLFIWQNAPQMLFQGDQEVEQIMQAAAQQQQEAQAQEAPAQNTGKKQVGKAIAEAPKAGTPPSASLSQVPL
ncbi:hypothetical protein CL633_04525 [bacterium]|jgi:hypothetical protein|nr:hypothetical protein [bacterium]|tara:strand:+ start:1283 stop:3139 length:1857 start_codon:yes stop_codon:yes gene_type:complete